MPDLASESNSRNFEGISVRHLLSVELLTELTHCNVKRVNLG